MTMNFRHRLILTGLALALATPVQAADPWDEHTAAFGQRAEMPVGRLDRSELDALTAQGEKLFSAKFTSLDGVGRPGATQAIDPTRSKHVREQTFIRTAGPDAGSCAACHNEPVAGGAGVRDHRAEQEVEPARDDQDADCLLYPADVSDE